MVINFDCEWEDSKKIGAHSLKRVKNKKDISI
jgi:hypothetical protein